MKCKTESAFMECKCKRCKIYKQNIINSVVSSYIQEIISSSLKRSFDNNKATTSQAKEVQKKNG